MARFRYEDAQSAIVDALQAAGGSATYPALVTALENGGNPQAIPYLPEAAQRRLFTRTVRAVPGERPEVVCALPNSAPPSAPPPAAN